MNQAHSIAIKAGGDLGVNARSFEIALRVRRRSPRTIRTYMDALARLSEFLDERGMPMTCASITGEHVNEFLLDQLARHKPATAANRFRSLQAFFKHLVSEGESKESPMARLKPPKVDVVPPPVLTEDDLRALLKTCEGTGFEERRDTAILRVFIDSGARLAEVSGLRYNPNDPTQNDIDFGQGLVRLRGKGGVERIVRLGDKTLLALGRYLKRRDLRRQSRLPWLWVGPKGRLADSGVAQMVKRRGEQAGIDGLHPHVFRHTMAHHWLAAGGTEGDLMRTAGWKSRSMLERYGASAAQERSWAAHEKFGLGDRL